MPEAAIDGAPAITAISRRSRSPSDDAVSVPHRCRTLIPRGFLGELKDWAKLVDSGGWGVELSTRREQS